MAVNIEFQGFVNEIKSFHWGTVYEISHNQVRKDHQGEWETVGRDYFSVIAPDGLEELAKGSRVSVTGRFKTKRFDKKDGTKGISLEVRAESINVLSSNQKTGHAAINEVWPVKQIADEAPF